MTNSKNILIYKQEQNHLTFFDEWLEKSITIPNYGKVIEIEKQKDTNEEIYYEIVFDNGNGWFLWYCKKCWILFAIEDEWDDGYCFDCFYWMETN